ncbi:hypothetical protein J4E83_005529 [Alternaria metachromatica]|uniref:uncharacterized protein n=1 Tax=Alternaria metachromatica TaxID=283354 RepID=UPI0020C1D70E|nr:uncharacterized protein J4E83_005529 [Alternaria metachromatica]KAI4619674.1 hypothetical protein J4E83_005529 [Alternaria metachromatica]
MSDKDSESGVTGGVQASIPILMTMSAFLAIGMYNMVEILFLIFAVFKQRRGLYFWSMLIAAGGIAPHAIGFILKFFQVTKLDLLSSAIIGVGWVTMCPGQSLVLYSRLHLVVADARKIRWVLYMIIFTTIALGVPLFTFAMGANSKDSLKFLPGFEIYDKVQIVAISVQEMAISVIYIFRTVKMLRGDCGRRRGSLRKLFIHLIIVNVAVLAFDITLIAVQFSGHYEIQTTYKTAIYSIKLKIEFSVLNRLVNLLQHKNLFGDGATRCHDVERWTDNKRTYSSSNRGGFTKMEESGSMANSDKHSSVVTCPAKASFRMTGKADVELDDIMDDATLYSEGSKSRNNSGCQGDCRSQIQGSSITVIVGQYPSRTYTLPVALLCVHSIFFRDQITRINAAVLEDHTDSKKRKLSTSNDDVVVIKEEDGEPAKEEDTKEDAKNEEKVIRLPDVDPAIFGLFLKFIYKDTYPSNVDARTLPNSANPYSRTASADRTVSVPATTVAPHSLSTQTPSHLQLNGPPAHIRNWTPTNMPPPPIPHNITSPQPIPPSIHAWLLAQRLGTLSFMNHTIQHIYSGIGRHFALTPTLIDHVWRETTPSSSPISTILTPSPLRSLLLHALTSYWSQPGPQQNPNAIILRSLSVSHGQGHFSTGLKDAWDRLFDEHEDLRNEFIHGLQAGPGQLGVVGAYFATSGTVVVGTGGGGVGRSEAIKGKEKEKDEGVGWVDTGRGVLIKEEESGEMRVLDETKATRV